MMDKINDNMKANGLQKLSMEDLEKVNGGGHYINDGVGGQIWIHLNDIGYAFGEDSYYDRAYILENLALSGLCIDNLADFACENWGGSKSAIVDALKNGGPVYLADCYRDARSGFHW